MGLRVRARLRWDTVRAPAHQRCAWGSWAWGSWAWGSWAWGSWAWFCKDRFVFQTLAPPHAGRVWKLGDVNLPSPLFSTEVRHGVFWLRDADSCWLILETAHLSPIPVGRFVPRKHAHQRGPHFPVLSIQIRYVRLCGGAARRARRNEAT